MYTKDGALIDTPSDLTLFLESPFASWMEHYALVAPENLPEGDPSDNLMNMLQEKGTEHEAARVELFTRILGALGKAACIWQVKVLLRKEYQLHRIASLALLAVTKVTKRRQRNIRAGTEW